MLNRIFRSLRVPAAAVSPGTRLYAIGDIHGRLDLLEQLLDMIAVDERERPVASSRLIFLGDLVDRGPDSAGVVEHLRRLALATPDARFLLGNHEEVFLKALSGDVKALKFFCRIGGRETILSYGVTQREYDHVGYDQLAEMLTRRVPSAHREFLASFEDMIIDGDYAFVHAGIRPDVRLAEQVRTDLRWIREPFLEHRGALEKTIVHGHTITEAVDFRSHRIGVDTGAYASGILSALVLEGSERRVIRT